MVSGRGVSPRCGGHAPPPPPLLTRGCRPLLIRGRRPRRSRVGLLHRSPPGRSPPPPGRPRHRYAASLHRGPRHRRPRPARSGRARRLRERRLDPGSGSYHPLSERPQFAHRFAPAPAEVAAIRARLRSRGLTVGAARANGLSLPVTATAGAASAAFRTQIESYDSATGATGYATDSPQALAASLGAGVQGVVGLTTVAPKGSLIERPAARPSSAAVHADAATATPAATSAAATTGPQACAGARASASANAVYTSDQIASRYGLSSFYAAGDEGHGVTIALYELEPFSASDIAAYQSCYGTSTNVQVETVDGGAGTGAGSGEAAMDIEDLIGLAPQATVRVYEGPSSGAGAYDTYSAIVADDAAQGDLEFLGSVRGARGLRRRGRREHTAAGGRRPGPDLHRRLRRPRVRRLRQHTSARSTTLARSPYATSVGGTTVHSTGDTAWNNAFGATGGGASQFWSEPSYQVGHAQAESAVSCGTSTSCREVPRHLRRTPTPNTGYLSWWNGAWHVVGGTSVAAPTIAALVALTDASPVCAGRSVGFLNPSLYALASGPTRVISSTSPRARHVRFGRRLRRGRRLRHGLGSSALRPRAWARRCAATRSRSAPLPPRAGRQARRSRCS